MRARSAAATDSRERTSSEALVAETTTSARSSSVATASSASALRPELSREILAVRERPVRDDGDLGAARTEVASCGFADLPGAEQEDAVAGEIAEHLLGKRCRRRRDRRRALSDRGLHPNTLPRVQRLAEEPVEKRACRAGFERRPHLAEDLPLAGNERVEPGGDSKQVERRRLVPQAIQRGGEIVSPVAGQLDERVDRFVVGVLLADEIELGAIAGREHDRLALELLCQPLGERAARIQIQRNPLAQLDRCSVMRDAGEGQLHEAKWVKGRTMATSAKPARIRSAPRRPRQPSCRRTRSTA